METLLVPVRLGLAFYSRRQAQSWSDRIIPRVVPRPTIILEWQNALVQQLPKTDQLTAYFLGQKIQRS